MRTRQERNHLSELGVNWIGKGHLNALESDLMYKYHVVRSMTWRNKHKKRSFSSCVKTELHHMYVRV